MLTYLSVILTNLAITLILVGFIWYYFKSKVENLENILNYQSQILKNAIQNNSIPNNDFQVNSSNNKINVVEDESDEDDNDDDDELDDEELDFFFRSSQINMVSNLVRLFLKVHLMGCFGGEIR